MKKPKPLKFDGFDFADCDFDITLNASMEHQVKKIKSVCIVLERLNLKQVIKLEAWLKEARKWMEK